MKPLSVFAHIFAIFAFLTTGSLILIVAFRILTVEDAIHQVRQLYENPWRSLQAAALGMTFISVGLGFTRMLLKKRRQAEALIFQSEIGPIVVSSTAIEDTAKKILKKFYLVKDAKIKTFIQNKDVELKVRLVLWSGGRIQALLAEIQEEIRGRVRKLLGPENKLEITCDIQRIEDHEAADPEINEGAASL